MRQHLEVRGLAIDTEHRQHLAADRLFFRLQAHDDVVGHRLFDLCVGVAHRVDQHQVVVAGIEQAIERVGRHRRGDERDQTASRHLRVARLDVVSHGDLLLPAGVPVLRPPRTLQARGSTPPLAKSLPAFFRGLSARRAYTLRIREQSADLLDKCRTPAVRYSAAAQAL